MGGGRIQPGLKSFDGGYDDDGIDGDNGDHDNAGKWVIVFGGWKLLLVFRMWAKREGELLLSMQKD